MSQLKAIAVNLARESGRSAAVIEYGLKVGLINLAGVAGVVTVGLVLGILPFVLTAYLASGSLRMTSGGSHTTTPVRCIAFTSLLFGTMGTIGYFGGFLVTGVPLQIAVSSVLLGVLLAILWFAPRDVPNKPIKKEQGEKLRRWAIAIWSVWVGLIGWGLLAGFSAGLVLSAVLGLGTQGLSLVPRTQPKTC